MNTNRLAGFRLRKIMLAYLIASPFISGYLFFLKIEFAGIVVDLFRMGLLACFCINLYLFIREKECVSVLQGKGRISLGIWFCLILAIGVMHACFQGWLPGGFSEIAIIGSNLLLFICVVGCIRSDLDLWNFAINAFMYTGIIIAIISCFEMVIGFTLPSSRFNEIAYFENLPFHPATSIFANENNLAAFFLSVGAIIIWRMLHEQKKKMYSIRCVQLVIVIFPTIIADSTIFKLGIMIVTLIACILFLIDKVRDESAWGKSCIQLLIPTLLCYILKKSIRKGFIFVGLKISHQGSLISNLHIQKLIAGDGMLDQLHNTGMGTVTMRKNLFFYGIDAGKLHPICGSGANSFSFIFKHNPNYLEETGNIVNPHNFLIEIFVQYGVVALALFLVICFGVFVFSIRRTIICRSINVTHYEMCLIVVMIIAFSITTVMPSSFFKGTVYFIPLLLTAIGVDLSEKEMEAR